MRVGVERGSERCCFALVVERFVVRVGVEHGPEQRCFAIVDVGCIHPSLSTQLTQRCCSQQSFLLGMVSVEWTEDGDIGDRDRKYICSG